MMYFGERGDQPEDDVSVEPGQPGSSLGKRYNRFQDEDIPDTTTWTLAEINRRVARLRRRPRWSEAPPGQITRLGCSVL